MAADPRATMAIVTILQGGGRVQVSSRGFWRQFGFPTIDVRQESQQAARAILGASQAAISGEVVGRLADLFQDQGYPDPSTYGGVLGGIEATMYGKVEITRTVQGPQGPQTETAYRTVSIQVPWDLSVNQIASWQAAAAALMGAKYGYDGAEFVEETFEIY